MDSLALSLRRHLQGCTRQVTDLGSASPWAASVFLRSQIIDTAAPYAQRAVIPPDATEGRGVGSGLA